MQRMRDVLRGSLGRSLRALSDEDRLAAAWPVACGPALAAHGEVLGLDAEYVLHVRVVHAAWREQFVQMRSMLTNDLRRIAGVRLETIHFEGQPMAGRAGRESARTQTSKR
ncbi:MAG TPA: DciA family protein [Acidobacteriaceae bacterium]|jgi:hypothetical protein|nr:DciA family protein [Acidobacteriaceae bacterium]